MKALSDYDASQFFEFSTAVKSILALAKHNYTTYIILRPSVFHNHALR